MGLTACFGSLVHRRRTIPHDINMHKNGSKQTRKAAGWTSNAVKFTIGTNNRSSGGNIRRTLTNNPDSHMYAANSGEKTHEISAQHSRTCNQSSTARVGQPQQRQQQHNSTGPCPQLSTGKGWAYVCTHLHAIHSHEVPARARCQARDVPRPRNRLLSRCAGPSSAMVHRVPSWPYTFPSSTRRDSVSVKVLPPAAATAALRATSQTLGEVGSPMNAVVVGGRGMAWCRSNTKLN